MESKILRAEDLLVVDVATTGLDLVTPGDGGGPDPAADAATAMLVRAQGQDAAITLTFPPQAFGEEAFFEAAPHLTLKDGHQPRQGQSDSHAETTTSRDDAVDDPKRRAVAGRRLAGPSRVVFRLAATVSAIPFTVEGLLAACLDAELIVPRTAAPARSPASILRPVPELELPPTTLSVTSRLVRRAMSGNEVSVATGLTAIAEGAASLPVGRVDDRASRVTNQSWRADPTRIEQVLARPQPPTPGQTAIEAPFRLFLSPHDLSAFVHSTRPVTLGGRRELWHSRLTTLPGDTAATTPQTVRAVWARTESGDLDVDNGTYQHDNLPFRMSLDDKDRRDLVVSSADPRFRDMRPIDASLLHVSALGASLDLHGQWTAGDRGTGIAEWAHRATLGRDNYVRVVYDGHLFPTGHAASLVKVTERRFHDRPANPRRHKADQRRSEATAYLRQRMYLVVREPDRSYGARWPKVTPQALHGWPVDAIRLKTIVTPDLDDPAKSEIVDGAGQSLFCPQVGDADFLFAATITDICGNRLDVHLPLFFVSVEGPGGKAVRYDRDPKVIEKLTNAYAATPDARNKVDAHGARMALAPARTHGDTELALDTLWLTATPLDATADGELGWYPKVEQVDAVLPSAAVLTGRRLPTRLKIAKAYIDYGFYGSGGDGRNRGEVFAEVVDPKSPLKVQFSSGGASSHTTGGFLSPDLAVNALSRVIGPVAGAPDLVGQVAQGTFDPTKFFAAAGVLPKLFGCIDLASLLEVAGLDLTDAAVPTFVTEALTAVDTLRRDLAQLERSAQAAITAAQSVSTQAKSQVESALNGIPAQVDTLATDLQALLAAKDTAAADAALEALGTHAGEAATALGTTISSLDAVPAAVVPPQLLKVVRGLLVQLRDLLAGSTDLIEALRAARQLAEELRVTFAWSTRLKSFGVFQASRQGRPAHLEVRATVQAKTKLHPNPSADVVCGLRDFTLLLVPSMELLSIEFTALEFRARPGAKPDVNVELGGIHFVGCLSFVEALRDLIPLDGFSDPPSLDVSEKGISAGYSMALPDISFGVFSLQNLSLSAAFTMPFLGDALTVRFGFCERQSPFLLTVACFGGGGFFALTVTPAGLKMVEASFEFGASLSMNFGVASGSVSVMGGIYYCMTADDAARLTGFLRIHGQVEVLGLVAVSLELALALDYQPASGKCAGRAVLTLSISIGFFEKSVSLECERTFAGSNGDPVLAQLVGPDAAGGPPTPWLDYWAAFTTLPA